MKTIILVIAFISLQVLFGQEANGVQNKSGIEDKKITQIFNPFKESIYSQYDIFGFDVFWSAWNQPNKDVKSGKFSFGFNFNYFFDIPFSKKSPVALAIGLGYGHFNLHHDGDLQPAYDSISDQNYTRLVSYSGQDGRKKNKILAQYIDIPVELRFRIPLKSKKNPENNYNLETGKAKHHFKIYLGFKAGYQVGFKQVTVDDNDTKTKFNNYSDKFRWRYGCTVRIGWNDIFLFGSYYFSPLFKNDLSTEIYPFTFGISIGG